MTTRYDTAILSTTDLIFLAWVPPVTLTRRPARIRLRALAHHDFSPEWSDKVRRFAYHPLAVLLSAGVASLLCGVFLHAQGFVLCGGVLAVAGLGVIWPWLTLRGVAGTVGFDRERSTEGESVGATLTVANRLPWAARGLAVRGGLSNRPGELAAAVASVPRRRRAACRWGFVPTARGVYPTSVPRLTTGFPFGLSDCGRAVGVASKLMVWPRAYEVGPVPQSGGDHRSEGSVSRTKVGGAGDVAGVRPYRRGDSFRRVHWAQSAKHDRLVVCELQSNARPVIQLVLDTDPRVHSGTGPDSSREWAIRVAASFAKGWLAEGAQVGLACAAFDLPPASGRAQLVAILDALAGLPDGPARPLAEVLACPKCSGFRDGLQVIITTDRTHAHGGCGACAEDDQRWVVLKTSAFADSGESAPCGHCPTPWLVIDSPESVPAMLKGAWREARHGS